VVTFHEKRIKIIKSGESKVDLPEVLLFCQLFSAVTKEFWDGRTRQATIFFNKRKY
jgi:hypothetical protein